MPGILRASGSRSSAAFHRPANKTASPPCRNSSEPEAVLAVGMRIHASLPPPLPKRLGLRSPQKPSKRLWESSAVGRP